MRPIRKISIICFLAMVLTLSIGQVNGYSWTHDENFGENYQPGFNDGNPNNGDRVYYYAVRPYSGYWAGYGPPPPPYPYYAPPPYYYAPPVSFVVPFPIISTGYYYGHHHRHHHHPGPGPVPPPPPRR